MSPILSICIPTRNRGAYLRCLLEILLPQIVKVGYEKVQVIVSDNASTDDTSKIVKELIMTYNVPIEYYHNDFNMGIRNIDLVASKAVGRYVLLMGDDDLLSPSFIDIIWPYLISSNTYGLIHWNRLRGDANCNNNLLFDSQYSPLLEMSFGDFLLRTSTSTDFMSSVLFFRECLDVGKVYLEDNWEGYRWWAQVLFGARELNFNCLYYYFPLVIQRNPIREWTDRGVYYQIVEIGQIFKKLDTYVPHAYASWIQRMHNPIFYDINSLLELVRLDIPYYRKCRDELIEHLNIDEIELLDRWLNAKDVIKAQNTYRKKMNLKKKIKKGLKLFHLC